MRNGKKRIPPQGDEQSVKSSGKTLGKSNGGNAGGNIPSDLAELIVLWPNLSQEIRNQCLELARGRTVHRPNADAQQPLGERETAFADVSSTTELDALNGR